jgi:hypothetical protein
MIGSWCNTVERSVITLSGTIKVDQSVYDVRTNGSPRTVDDLANVPLKQVNGTTIYLRDVASVSDGFQVQTNVVRQDGRRGVVVSILKNGNASTLDVVKGIRAMLPRVASTVPPGLKMSPLSDQSIFVRAAVQGVIREAVIAAALTAIMILVFLGSWRSTLIIAVSIPLSILTSVIALGLIGETINTMTLADLESSRLSLHAELALDYFNLRSADAQRRLLDDTVKAFKSALQLTEDRYSGGASPLSDVTQARTQLQAAQVQATDVDIQRASYEHAIAVLIGKQPAVFSLPPNPITIASPAIPAIPGMLPSELLERRPDIASSERSMAAANEQIGIARTAFYPTLSLSAVAGFVGTSALNWFSWPSRFFAVGPALSQTLFDNGRRRATSDIARAQYDGTVAAYRQTTLTAFQQVEDNLSALQNLEVEARQQRDATASAQQSLDLFNARYEDGVDTYLQVITWQTALLENERNDIEITRRRFEASVLLVKALGGGWDESQLPQQL